MEITEKIIYKNLKEVYCMDLSTVTIHEVKGSFIAYIPKPWIRQMKLKKGDKITWSVDEGDHEALILKKMEDNDDEVH